MTHTLLLIHSATYFGLWFICIVEWAAALGDDSPFYKIPNNNNNTINDINNKCNSSNNNSETKRWRKRAISRKIYNVDWYIYRQYAAIDAPCVWIPFFSFAFRFLFPFLFFLFSLAFKCPFHFLFGCLFPQSLSFMSSLRLFKEKNMRPFSLTGYYYFIQRAIHPIRKRKTCIDLYEMRRPGQTQGKRIIFTLISTIGDCCLGHRILNQDPHALVLALLTYINDWMRGEQHITKY